MRLNFIMIDIAFLYGQHFQNCS